MFFKELEWEGLEAGKVEWKERWSWQVAPDNSTEP